MSGRKIVKQELFTRDEMMAIYKYHSLFDMYYTTDYRDARILKIYHPECNSVELVMEVEEK